MLNRCSSTAPEPASGGCGGVFHLATVPWSRRGGAPRRRVWYTGRTSEHTLKLVLADGGFLYSSDSYADDLPYWVKGPQAPHLIIPYTLDTNDMRFIGTQGFANGDEFFAYLRDAFDFLYREREHAPKIMSVGLHCRLAGRPGRAVGIERVLDHIAKFDPVRQPARVAL